MLDERGGFVQHCGKACENSEQRERWGCDGPTAEADATIAVDCFVCRGREPECVECHGEGRIEIRECPWRRIKQEHQDAVLAVLLMERGILPAPGAWQDQSATFVAAWPLLANELEHWRKVARDRAFKEK